jgi:hypothetical protein
MRVTSQNYLSQEYIIDDLFSLAVTQKIRTTKIIMQSFNNHVTTASLPLTSSVLQLYLPHVLETECFNEEGLPFALEVKKTELGHLFEHILLEYLCAFKIAKGYKEAVFEGRTKWNWIRDPRGQFHIYLNCGKKDADILLPAIEKTIELMKRIMETDTTKFARKRKILIETNGLKNGKQETKV